ncbi:hypothetical protein LDL08_31520 [Nonomuraea glycinis]|uniref:Uncharacterized protein n=1 Tax=Nonomuraea glycinis TaxID=2047744 RepID=A0A918AC29_9ACTN|nr:hypothetical protein [Nonomuraea glycinis]MCA2180717.1 hypothetical protein [Nonomuraea glycinis]GGP11853.1 hypothetical protein GCM10012278_57270 [Nonomuraea glycinis]
MNFCLSDLVPPLRWSDASTITLLTGQPDLPDGWWRSLPMPRVLAAIGPDALGGLLTEIALEHWPAAAVGDVLPALHLLDPDEADDPHVAIALDRAGSWAGLLALTSRELVDQPFVHARPVLNALFSAALVRLAPTTAHPAPRHPEPPAPPEKALAPEKAVAQASPAAAAAAAVAAEAKPAEPAAATPDHEIAEPTAADPEAAKSEAAGSEAAGSEAAGSEVVAPESAVVLSESAAAVARAHEAHAQEAQATPDERGEDTLDEESEEEPQAAQHAEQAPEEAEPAALGAGQDAGPAVLDARDEPIDEAGEAGAESDAASESDADAAFESDAESDADAESDPDGSAEAAGLTPVPDAASQDAASQEGQDPEPDGEVEELPGLIEAAFAGLDDKSWAVAQNRVFTDQPSAVDQLAKLFAVPPAEISATEVRLWTKLDNWLASDEAAPYRAHLDELRKTIGTTAPKERLISAAAWHGREIRALEVPAWQFVLATLPPGPHVPPQESFESDEGAAPSVFAPAAPLPLGPMPGQPMPQAASLPPGFVPPDPVPSQFQAFAPAVAVPGDGNGSAGEQAGKPYQPLKDVSQTRRCFRQPDGRWWLRIDVTAEQLSGSECALPTGFAAYLGLSPGESRTVRSAAGELTMTWHGRPVLETIERLLADVGAKEGGHLFLTLSDEGVLRARHLPVAAQGAEHITKALRLVGYTAPGGTRDQAARVIATRIGMTGPVGLPDLLTRLRERGDRDLLALLD